MHVVWFYFITTFERRHLSELVARTRGWLCCSYTCDGVIIIVDRQSVHCWLIICHKENNVSLENAVFANFHANLYGSLSANEQKKLYFRMIF